MDWRTKTCEKCMFQVAGECRRFPTFSNVMDYFPDALLAVANCSYMGNEQHNPGMPLHWDRSKSTDEADAMIRHFLDLCRVCRIAR